MKALVTGGTGFIGSHLAEHLEKRGFEVYCTVRDMNKLKWLEGKPYKFVHTSLLDETSLKDTISKVDYIFHVAGVIAARNYEEFLRGNRDVTTNLLNCVQKYNPNIKRLVYVSSQTVAGPSQSLENPLNEESPCKPLTLYAKSKKAAEEEVIKLGNSFKYTIIRPSGVFGPRDYSIFPLFKSVKYNIGTMMGFEAQYLNLAYPADLCRGIIDAALSNKTISQLYFLTSEETCKYSDLIDLVKKAYGKKYILKIKIPKSLFLSIAAISGLASKAVNKPSVFNYEKGIDLIQKYWTCSVEKAKRDFGYKQEVSMEQAIKETVIWYKQNRWL